MKSAIVSVYLDKYSYLSSSVKPSIDKASSVVIIEKLVLPK